MRAALSRINVPERPARARWLAFDRERAEPGL